MAVSTQSSAPLGNQSIISVYTPAIASAPTQTVWRQFVNATLMLQVSGTATSFTVQVYRSDVDPQGPLYANNAVVAGTTVTGAAGSVVPVTYAELGQGWWAVTVTAVSGGFVNVSLSGVSA